ncbi:hypothetical protein B0H66DRAFT_385011 [Apodospora peruviana]|uniref:Uncharacterized protein n=1 Tax=Apodospora peruviana TaxID=516989 RepID=A0AAE0HUC6_9PEZI|nr:hypothetical protein B0H66DRAFT_385011 [Apodospora peruviana]
MSSFRQFARLPGELQDMVWDEAATISPLLQFLKPMKSESHWSETEVVLAPSRESGAVNLVHLSLACRGARAAVLRRNRGITNKTIFRTFSFQGLKAMDLTVDLSVDLVGLANDYSAKWGEYDHLIFWSARRVAFHYNPRWDVMNGVLAQQLQDGLTSAEGCIHTALSEDFGTWTFAKLERGDLFCARCMANALHRFHKPKEFYLIVDPEVISAEGDSSLGAGEDHLATFGEHRGSNQDDDDPASRGSDNVALETFHSYNRTYFEISERDAKLSLRKPVAAMEAIRACLSIAQDPSSVKHVSKMKFGILSWYNDGSR